MGPRYERAKVKFDLFLRLFEYETEIHGSRLEKLLILRFILKMGRDIFVKFQKNLTSRQLEHVGPRNERANVKFGLFLPNFEYRTDIRGSRMEKLLILRPLY